MRPTARQPRPVTTKKVVQRQSRYKPASAKKSGRGVVGWISGFVVLLVIGLGIRSCNKSIDDKDVLNQMHQVVAEISNYHKYSEYYDSLVDKFHSQAFEKAYKLGGRHRANTLNEKSYLVEITALMLAQARSDGKNDVAEMLEIINGNARMIR